MNDKRIIDNLEKRLKKMNCTPTFLSIRRIDIDTLILINQELNYSGIVKAINGEIISNNPLLLGLILWQKKRP